MFYGIFQPRMDDFRIRLDDFCKSNAETQKRGEYNFREGKVLNQTQRRKDAESLFLESAKSAKETYLGSVSSSLL